MTVFSREIIAIVPAAGIGSRMQADRPKQYLLLLGKTVLEHTLERLLAFEAISQIIVAVAEHDTYFHQLAIAKHPKIKRINGGETRADSVLNGLNAVKNPDAWVMVHDAARPCVRKEDLQKILAVTENHGGILAIPVVDTIKRSNASQQIIATEDRSELWQAQTPQFFPVELLRKALTQALTQGATITDEASAMEFLGYQPQLVAGRADNLKITRPEDLGIGQNFI